MDFGLIKGVFAQVPCGDGGAQPCSVAITNPLGSNNILEILDNIIDFLLLIGVPILAIMILIGGFYILTARDDKEKVVTGRKVIYYAVIGFAIILISKGVSTVILEILSP